MTDPLTYYSYAKVNLGLKILNKRPDNYHNIHSLFIEINLSDELTFLANKKYSFNQLCNKNGNASITVPGKSEELCGTQLAQGDQQEASEEAIAKIITARNGDICIIAENGNIKFKAKNIYVECVGDGNDGSFLLKANDHITMTAGEQITISGSKLCMLSSDSITLNAQGFLNLFCADVVKSSPINVVAKLLTGDILGGFIDTVRKTCG